jgi:preprotein translocase subunit SecE
MMKRDEERRKAVPRPVRAAGAPAKKERTKPTQFVREVIAELRKVAWPTRKEVVGYSLVVLVASVVVAALIFGEDFLFTKLILGLFGVDV